MSIILVGEIGLNHNGNIILAKKLIGLASLAKLDYVKFIISLYPASYIFSK